MQMSQLRCWEEQQGQTRVTAMQGQNPVTAMQGQDRNAVDQRRDIFFPHPLISAIFFAFVTRALFFLAL